MAQDTYGVYDLEISKVIEEIKKKNARSVLLQFPDGLKQYAGEIVDRVRSETGAMCLIWAQSNFGACDTPLGIQQLQVDLVVTFGHNLFHKLPSGW